MSASFAHQSPTLPQIIDSREGLFRCKMGLVVHADKMNIYFIKPRLHHILGCLLLNIVQYGTKRSAFWC